MSVSPAFVPICRASCQQAKTLAPLSDDLVLLDSGLDGPLLQMAREAAEKADKTE